MFEEYEYIKNLIGEDADKRKADAVQLYQTIDNASNQQGSLAKNFPVVSIENFQQFINVWTSDFRFAFQFFIYFSYAFFFRYGSLIVEGMATGWLTRRG